MILGVVGSRSFNSYDLLDKTIKNLLYYKQIIEIVSGGALGADQLGALYAKTNNLKLTEFLPDWDKYGKSAGFKRNELIVNYADIVLAMWDGESKGTKHSIGLTHKVGKTCIVIKYDH